MFKYIVEERKNNIVYVNILNEKNDIICNSSIFFDEDKNNNTGITCSIYVTKDVDDNYINSLLVYFKEIVKKEMNIIKSNKNTSFSYLIYNKEQLVSKLVHSQYLPRMNLY